MIRCSNECIPICDFCIWCQHERYFDKVNGKRKLIKSQPLFCWLHFKRVGTGYCKNFHCFNAKGKKKIRYFDIKK